MLTYFTWGSFGAISEWYNAYFFQKQAVGEMEWKQIVIVVTHIFVYGSTLPLV